MKRAERGRRDYGLGEARKRGWDEVDSALLVLIRLVLDDSWQAHQAASEMAAKVPDEWVLRRLRIRVLSALAERPTPVAERAASTLKVLLDGRRPLPTLVER